MNPVKQIRITIFKMVLTLATLVSVQPRMALAKVLEIHNYTEVKQFLANDTLIVTDLDNTVVESTQMLGSVQWVDDMVSRLQKTEFSSVASELGSMFFAEINRVSGVLPVEHTTPQLLNLLSMKADVIALTARPLTLVDRTIEQLEENNIRLKTPEYLSSTNPLAGVRFKNGVLFAGGQNKGVVLKNILQTYAPNKYKRVLFIDDKHKYVEQVDIALSSEKYEVFALRYNYADKKVSQYDRAIAEKERSHFHQTGEILSDEEARR